MKRSDHAFLEWLKMQPSCISGQFSEYHDGVGYSIPCHVRRANNSGTGFKPEYSAVPMTNEEHQYQHQKGEAALLYKEFGLPESVEWAKFWFETVANKYLTLWRAK